MCMLTHTLQMHTHSKLQSDLYCFLTLLSVTVQLKFHTHTQTCHAVLYYPSRMQCKKQAPKAYCAVSKSHRSQTASNNACLPCVLHKCLWRGLYCSVYYTSVCNRLGIEIVSCYKRLHTPLIKHWIVRALCFPSGVVLTLIKKGNLCQLSLVVTERTHQTPRKGFLFFLMRKIYR